MNAFDRRLELASLTPLHWGAIALALLSAGIHLVLGIRFLPHWMGIAFFVATAGFLAGVALVLLGARRHLVYLLGIPFTGGQIALWYLVASPATLADVSAAAAVDKVAQALLIAALVALYARDS